MRDRRDFLILGLAGALLFCLGLLVGHGPGVLPEASAQDPGLSAPPGNPNGGGNNGGVTIDPTVDIRPGFEGRSVAPTASDSNSNNRFVAITTPVGSGESVLFVLDAKHEQLLTYRFVRGKGLEFLAARKIDYDLRITEWNDQSRFTRDEMKIEFERQAARAVADAIKNKSNG